MNRGADRPVMLRAGGEVRGVPAFTTPVTCMADVSEFQPQVNDAAYLAWSKAIAIRAAYGAWHDDDAWYGGARRDALHAAGAEIILIYQYLVAGQDAAAQAHAFVSLVGNLRPGEKLVCDLEEGDGDQSVRYRQWSAVLAAAYGTGGGASPWLYSGLDFAAAHCLQPDWVADYGPSEPAIPHVLWQFTPSYPVPGVGVCDASIYRGTVSDLAASAYGGRPAPPPSPANWTEALVRELPVLQQGSAGEDVRTAQGLLVARGHTVTVDGAFGGQTHDAILAYQTAVKVAADGIVGPLTWTALLGL